MKITICDCCQCRILDKDEVWEITVVNNEGLSFAGGELHKAKQKRKIDLCAACGRQLLESAQRQVQPHE